MVETENPRKLPIFWMGLAFLLVGVFIFMWWFLSKKKIPFMRILTYFIIAAVIICILIAIVFLALWLFKKQRTDMIHIMKQRIIKACNLRPPVNKQQLWFMGSSELECKYIGEITGIAKAKSQPVYEKGINDEGIETSDEIKKAMDLTLIAFQSPMSFPFSLFISKKVFVGLKWKDDKGKEQSDYSHLSGSIVYLKGMTFAPELYGLYFLSNHFQDTFMIDEVVTNLIYRYQLQENLSELKNIVDETLSISPEHRKAIDRSKIHHITGGSPPQPPSTPTQ